MNKELIITIPVPNFRRLVKRNKLKIQGILMILMALLAMKMMPEDGTAALVLFIMGIAMLVTGLKGLRTGKRSRRKEV